MKNFTFILKILVLFFYFFFFYQTHLKAKNCDIKIDVSQLGFRVSIKGINVIYKTNGIHTINFNKQDYSLTNFCRINNVSTSKTLTELYNNYPHYQIAYNSTSIPKNITSIEYFIDIDPGFGNGYQITTPISNNIDMNFVIPLSLITEGFHSLYIRVKDDQNKWSLTHTMPFYKTPTLINPSNKNITKIEYFIDIDPGFGSGTQLSTSLANSTSTNFIIPLTAVANGFHNLIIRVCDDQNKWSLTHTVPFYKTPPLINQTNKNITKIEYFVDTDPGFGNGNQLSTTHANSTSTDFNIPLSSLGNGFHTLYIRVKDDQNIWSLTHTMPFYKTPITINALNKNITKVEYFIDTDPGFGNGSQLNSNLANNISTNINIPLTLSSVGNGIHTLYIRVKDDQNSWSLTHNVPFYIIPQLTSNKVINQLEYFVDTDPGLGNGTTVPTTINSNISQNFIVDLSSLSNSFHRLYIRAKDNLNQWSLTQLDTFRICIPPPKPLKPIGITQMCINSPNSTYTTNRVANISLYNWRISPSTAGTISGNDTIGTVIWNSSFSGNAYITALTQDNCDNTPSDSLLVIINNIPLDASIPLGPSSVFRGQIGITYTIAPILNAISYEWTLPNGANGVSNTNTISVDFTTNAYPGYITVKGYNDCGYGASDSLYIDVSSLPAGAGNITGLTTVCNGQANVVYTVPPIIGADSYVWTLPQGVTGNSLTNIISVTIGNAAITDSIKVYAHNANGDGASSSLLINVNSPTN